MRSEPSDPVVAAFNAAAETYDAATPVQRAVAGALVTRAARLQPAAQDILDLGAGAGHVTGLALARWPTAQLTALDAAPAMLARLKAKFPQVATITRDARRLDGLTRYDLILSSMMLHWLDDPRAALIQWRDHLAPGGVLCIAVPVEGSLAEWRALTRDAGLDDALWRFPPADFAANLGAGVEFADFPQNYRDARQFLRALKQAGAHSARPGARPTTTGAMRRLLATRDGPFTATFLVAFVTIKAPAATGPAGPP
ncbi:MAG TPA: methyltransferase domain-containing protein [Rhodoblastus sp.]|nr:methyltransferase domain-containing protein [Rhodoblastus sp.]